VNQEYKTTPESYVSYQVGKVEYDKQPYGQYQKGHYNHFHSAGERAAFALTAGGFNGWLEVDAILVNAEDETTPHWRANYHLETRRFHKIYGVD